MKIILASASPRRKALLAKHGILFRVQPSHIPENIRASNPQELVKKLALKKARHVAKRHRDSIVLGADTVVVLRKRILGKPKDKEDAVRILKRLSGSRHKVYTGMALVHGKTNKIIVAHEVSIVK